jgi:hypothetical protein
MIFSAIILSLLSLLVATEPESADMPVPPSPEPPPQPLRKPLPERDQVPPSEQIAA